MPYGRSSYVYQQRPSILNYILSGLGQAAESLAAAYAQKKLREGQLTTNVLEGVLSGQTDPALFATGMAQDILRSKGIANQPQIKTLTAQALEKFQTPEKTMTSPSGAMVNIPAAQPSAIPLDLYQKYQAEREAALRRQKFYQEELPEYTAKEATRLRLTNEINKEFEETPEEVIQHVYGIIQEAKNKKIPLENLTYKGVDVFTAVEKAKQATDQNVKALAGQGKYYKGYSDAQDYRTNAVKVLTGLKSGTMTTDQASGELRAIDPHWDVLEKALKLFGIEGRAKRSPEDLKAVLREMNRSIAARNKENKLYAREGLIKPSEVEEIEPISEDILSDLEPTESTPNPRGQLQIAARAESGKAARAEEQAVKQPSPAEIEAEAKKLIQVSMINPETRQTYTWAEARQVARKYLLWKQQKGQGR
jgi:hypothetical protein